MNEKKINNNDFFLCLIFLQKILKKIKLIRKKEYISTHLYKNNYKI